MTTDDKIEQAIQLFREGLPDVDFGIGHIVIADGNTFVHSVEFCLNQADLPSGDRDWRETNINKASRAFLILLKMVLEQQESNLTPDA